ncbi:MAG: transcriptional repressor, partial [Myxococcota bacterium]
MTRRRASKSAKTTRRVRRDLRGQAREQLRAHGLRVTVPRVEVLLCLTERKRAMTHSEVAELLSGNDFDAATVYRNLVKLSQHGVLDVVSRAGGMARYALADREHVNHQEHVHFLCTDCGTVSCLPNEVRSQIEARGRWRAAVSAAQV